MTVETNDTPNSDKQTLERLLSGVAPTWVRKVGLLLAIGDYVKHDRDAQQKPTPWYVLGGQQGAYWFVIGCFVLALIGLFVSVGSSMAGHASLIPVLTPLPLIWVIFHRVRMGRLNVSRFSQDHSAYLVMAEKLSFDIRTDMAKEALVHIKEGRELSTIDYLRLAAYLIDLQNEREKAELRKKFDKEFLGAS